MPAKTIIMHAKAIKMPANVLKMSQCIKNARQLFEILINY